MSKFKVNVKWGKESYQVEVDTAEAPSVFKAQLFALTNVPVERQKIMLKGMLKDDNDWGTFKNGLKDGVNIMLMGTADANVVAAPTQKITFAEDLPPEERDNALASLPPGLQNLENTCYFNSTVQALASVPELTKQVLLGPAPAGNAGGDSLAAPFKNLFLQMKTSRSTIVPFELLARFRLLFPNFAEQANGHYKQQDAEEAWTQLLFSLHQVPKLNPNVPGENAVQQLFQGKFITTHKNAEATDEPATFKTEVFEKLQCYIQQSTNFLADGLRLSLDEKISKKSPTLNRDATYDKVSRISKLPFYLTVQFVRFYWKPGQIKAKIVRPVQFPFELDVHEFCSDDLKQQLAPKRKLLIDATEKNVEPKLDLSPLANETGIYELQAVVTHKGLDADGGHYVAWVRDDDNKRWILYDDDNVSEVTEEDVKKLDGKQSAQWHMAYMLLYRSKVKFEKK